ncbi:MAG: hypothetical protein AAF267_15375 [Deinococcota bacterium]
MANYTTNKKQVDTFEGRVYTGKYTIYGLLYTPSNEDMDRYLNTTERSFVPISEPMIYQSCLTHPPDIRSLSAAPPFIAVHKEKILWLMGARASEEVIRHSEQQRMAILFDDFFLSGNVRHRENTRMSAFLEAMTSENTFQTLTNVHLCKLKHRGYEVFNDNEPLETFDTAVVNLHNAEGVIEFESQTDGSVAEDKPKTIGKGSKVRVKMENDGSSQIEIGRIQREISEGVYLMSFEDRLGERNDLVIVEKEAIVEVLS